MDIIQCVDGLLDKYAKEHKGESPSYIILSPEDSDLLLREIKKLPGQSKSEMVTSYKGSKIVQNVALHNGSFYVSSELPETGS